MDSAKIVVTAQVPAQRTFGKIAAKTAKIIIFFLSFGMVYPHIFTEED
jgi:hypothetical protein